MGCSWFCLVRDPFDMHVGMVVPCKNGERCRKKFNPGTFNFANTHELALVYADFLLRMVDLVYVDYKVEDEEGRRWKGHECKERLGMYSESMHELLMFSSRIKEITVGNLKPISWNRYIHNNPPFKSRALEMIVYYVQLKCISRVLERFVELAKAKHVPAGIHTRLPLPVLKKSVNISWDVDPETKVIVSRLMQMLTKVGVKMDKIINITGKLLQRLPIDYKGWETEEYYEIDTLVPIFMGISVSHAPRSLAVPNVDAVVWIGVNHDGTIDYLDDSRKFPYTHVESIKQPFPLGRPKSAPLGL